MKYPKCALGCVISPGEFIVISKDRKHLSEIKKLEICMTKEIRNNKLEIFDLNPLMWVAVSFPESNDNYKRGVIEKKIKDDVFEIFMVDYGYFVQRNLSAIKLLVREEYTSIEPLAFRVKLYGILPCRKIMINNEPKYKVSRVWSADAESFVYGLFRNNSKVLVESIYIRDRNVYGDLYVKSEKNLKYVSLRKLLCKNNFCFFSKKNFLQMDGFFFPCDNFDTIEKMKEVKEWQKKHFSKFQENQNNLKTNVGLLQKYSKSLLKNERICSARMGIRQSQNERTNCSNVKSSYKNTILNGFSFGDPFVSKGIGRGQKLLKLTKNVENTQKRTINKLVDDIHETASCCDVTHSSCSTKTYESSTVDKFIFIEQKATNTPSDSCSKFDEVKKGSLIDLGRTERLSLQFQAYQQFWTPLILFENCIVEPVNTFKELLIEPNIIKNLEKGGAFNDLSSLQRWAIPTIWKRHNLVMIGSSRTGKTLSYIIPLIDYIQERARYYENPEGNGPCVVILGSGARFCESIYFLCHFLLGNHSKAQRQNSQVKVVFAHGGGREESVWVKLTNGCDILISTPHCLARLLELPMVTNFERLTCLVLDEIDIISQDPFRQNVRVILEKAKFSQKNYYYQKIFCGEKWTPAVESLTKAYVPSHTLIVASYLEAAIYKKLKPSIYFVDQNQKLKLILDIVLEKIHEYIILIVCESSVEAQSVHEFLVEHKISSSVAHEKILADDLKEILQIWKSSSPRPVLVSTDGVLCEINIQGVQILVHYGLPTKSKTNFFLRYSVFRSLNPFFYSKKHFEKFCNLSDIVLVDDENHYQLPHIVNFILRLGGEICPKIVEKCDEISKEIEKKKTHVPICENLLAFGKCRSSNDCSRRHALLKALDSTDCLPTGSWVNFSVLKVHDTTHFSGRLIGVVDDEGKESKFSDDYLQISIKLSNFYCFEENRRPLGNPTFGDVCAIKSKVGDADVFYRAKVIECLNFDKHGSAVITKVRLIDVGDVKKLKAIELYELPSELASYSPTAVEIIVLGVQPFDFDQSWSKESFAFSESLLTQTLDENQYWSGKIKMSLNGILFLKPVILKRILPNLDTHAIDFVVEEELMRNRLAINNEDHFSVLFGLCSEAGLCVPFQKKLEYSKNNNEVFKPEWAFLDGDFITVKFLAAENFSTIFLQSEKFVPLLDNLEVDCQKEATMSENSKGRGNTKLCIGMFCLARFEDAWNRGRIEFENENYYNIFFVDHGDFVLVSKTDVLPISKTLLARLPFQAVECRLIGLDPKQDCSIEVLKKIYEFSKNGEEYLQACVLDKCVESFITGGPKYVINLLNNAGKSLNKQLAEMGTFALVESEKHHLNDAVVEILETNSDAEEDRETTESWITQPNCEESPIFSLLPDELFENEEGQLFLQEFASKVFLEGTLPSEKFGLFTIAGEKEAYNKSLMLPTLREKRIEENSTSADEKHLSAVIKSQIKKVKRPKKQFLDRGRARDKRTKKTKRKKNDFLLMNRENVLTPNVVWNQDPWGIRIKVLLGNVENYRLHCSFNNLLLRCFFHNKLYAVDLNLFGVVSPHLTTVASETFHMVIVLKKLTAFSWPRLLADDGKQWWLALDVNNLEDKENNSSSDHIRSVKRNLNAGIVKEGRRAEIIRECSDSEDQSKAIDSEQSE